MIGIALLLLSGATQAAPHGPVALSAPASWFGADDYPPAAVRASEEGAVRFTLDISDTGAVTGCRVVESSGFSDLDSQTCSLAMQRAKFRPATDNHGKPIRSDFTQRTRWVMPHPQEEMADSPFGAFLGSMNVVTANARVRIDAAGKVVSCAFVNAANTTVNPCEALPIGKTIVLPSSVNGNAVGGTATVTMMISVKPDGLVNAR
jgi:protein TonB